MELGSWGGEEDLGKLRGKRTTIRLYVVKKDRVSIKIKIIRKVFCGNAL